MQVEKYQNSDVARIHMLEEGDVFRADSSYTVTDISENNTKLSVRQSIYKHPETYQERVQFDVDVCDNVHYSSKDRNCTLDEILRVNRISIRDKFFVVADIEYIAHGEGHKVTALESDALGTPKENGLSLEFYQKGFSNPKVTFPHYVSHNENVAKQAKERKFKAA